MTIRIVILTLAFFSCAEKPTGLEEMESIQAINNRDYFGCALEGMESATEQIDVLMYLAKYTPKSEDSVYILLNTLVEADRRGVRVRVLLENSLEENVVTADYLVSEGIEVKFDPPNVTTHAKFILIDREFLLLGSSNWTNHALRLNNETNLLVSEAGLTHNFGSYFDQLWTNSRKSGGLAPLFQEP